MPIIEMPTEFDLNYYKNSYPELMTLPDEAVIEHYKMFAVEQGRSTCSYDRSEYLQAMLQKNIDDSHLSALEISPWDNPFLRGDNVKYFGVEDAETLRKAADDMNRPFKNAPIKIHFVGENGNLSVVNEKFDIVFSAHVIEHCPDLVEHLQSVSKILNAGGLYVLIIPDKRYCFDYYHPESTISEVIDAFANGRKFPRLADVINFAYTRTHNAAVLHWLDYHGERYGYKRQPPVDADAQVEIMGEYFFDDGTDASFEKFSHLVERYSEALEHGSYISAHNWRFTPENFGYIINMLNQLNLVDLPIYRLCHTIWGRQEFIAMLEKK